MLYNILSTLYIGGIVMSEKNNSKCVVCGKGYYLCMSCKDKMKLSPYRVLTDTSEHYKILQIIKSYNEGIYNKKDAQKALSNIDVSDKDTYVESVRKTLDKILADDKDTTKFEKTTNVEVEKESDSKSEDTDESVKTDKVQEIVKSTTPVNSRKRNKSVRT